MIRAMRIALVVVAFVGCKAKEDAAISVPVSAEEARAQIGSAIDGSARPPPRVTRFPGLPQCDVYDQAMTTTLACDRIPQASKDALKQAYDMMKESWTQQLPTEAQKAANEGCKAATDAMRQMLDALGCELRVEAVTDSAPTGSRDVPSEKGVPLDRAVLGSRPHPFGALQSIKPTMTREELLVALPEARRDGENITVSLGVEALTAKILIDTTEHISDIEIPMQPFPSELFEQAWGESEGNVWLDRTAMWRADYGGNDNALHIFPYKRLVDVIGAGPDLLAETTPLIGTSITALREKLDGRIDDWTEEDEDGIEVTRPRLLLPSTEVCHFDSLYVLRVTDDTVTGATFTQCFDSDTERKTAMMAMEKRWGRAMPARTADDRLVFRFSRPGRSVEMTEDPTVDPAGAWIVKIDKR